MIPTYETNLMESITTDPDYTPKNVYKIDWNNNRLLSRKIDGQEAVSQNIKVITTTEYQEHQVMPDWFGLAMKDMYGMPMSFVKANMEFLIKDALSTYEIIKRAYDFKIEEINKYELGVTLTIELQDGTTFEEFLEVPVNV